MLVDQLKVFVTFLFLGGLLRRWIYNKISSFIVRFIVIGSLICGVSLLFAGKAWQFHLVHFGLIIIAMSLGMIFDAGFDKFTTLKAKERNGFKK